jgi:hypothetical protein
MDTVNHVLKYDHEQAGKQYKAGETVQCTARDAEKIKAAEKRRGEREKASKASQ